MSLKAFNLHYFLPTRKLIAEKRDFISIFHVPIDCEVCQ